jgi:5-methylcytosine-specific restriction endonuclease McrA
VSSLPTSKICIQCKVEKPHGEFYRKQGDRLLSRCKLCHNAHCLKNYYRDHEANKEKRRQYQRGRYQADPEAFREAQRRWREANPEAARAADRRAGVKRRPKKAAYRAANAERIRQKNAEYRDRNREKLRAQGKAYYRKNKAAVKQRIKKSVAKKPEKYKEIHRLWKQRNKARVNASTHKRRARLAGCAENYTAAEWLALVKACDHRCLCCGEQEPKVKLTVDHVVPVSEGGANAIWNLQPLCKPCNCKKHTGRDDFRPAKQRKASRRDR